MIANIFTKNHASLNVQFTANDDYAAMALISQGLGYCVVPEGLAEITATRLTSLPLESPEYLDIVIAVSLHKGQNANICICKLRIL